MTELKIGTVGAPDLLQGSLAERRRLLDRAADSGIDHLFLADHVSFHTGLGMDALVNAATLLASHETLEVCVGVYLLALRHPMPVARQLATLSQSAPGRVIFGVGVGGEDRHEIEVCGVDPKTRGRRTNECLEVLERVLHEETSDFSGEFFEIENAQIVPRPEPAIPVLVGGRSTAAVERAARYGDGWLAAWCSPRRMAEVAEQFESTRSHLSPRRTTEPLHGLQIWVGFGHSPEAARPELKRQMEAFYRVPFEAFERYSPFGTPAQVADFLTPYVQAGCRLFNVKAVTTDIEHEIAGIAEVAERLRALS